MNQGNGGTGLGLKIQLQKKKKWDKKWMKICAIKGGGSDA